MKNLFAIGIIALLSGCACPQKAILRESLASGSTQAWNDVRDWGQQLVIYPVGQIDPRTNLPSDGKNRATTIPPLSPQAYQELLNTKKEYEDFITADRATDGK